MSNYILYHGPVTAFGAQQVEQTCIQLLAQHTEELTLLICSGGGDVGAGIGVYNFLRMCPFRLTTHAMGLCSSIASTIYLAGTKRTTTASTRFTLHAASYIDGPRAGQISESTESISAPFKTELEWTDELIVKYFGTADEQSIFPEEAIKLGMVHELAQPTFAADDLIVTIDPSRPVPVNPALSGATSARGGRMDDI